MKVDKKMLKERYDEYYKLYFDSKLPRFEFRVSSAYRCHGSFQFTINKKSNKAVCRSIMISDLFDYTEKKSS